MKVSVEISVVEFDSDGVVGFLVYGPYEANEVEGEILAAATPGSAAGLKGSVGCWLPNVVGAAFGAGVVAVVLQVFEAAFVAAVGFWFGVAHAVIVNDKVIVYIVVVKVHELVERVTAETSVPPPAGRGFVCGTGIGDVIEEGGRLDWALEKALFVGREDIR